MYELLAVSGLVSRVANRIPKYINSRINNKTIEPVIAIGMTLRFGQPLFEALTRLTIDITRQGIKTAKIAPMMMRNRKMPAIPKMNTPINPIGKLYIYLLFIATFFIFISNCNENSFIFIIKIATIIVWLLAISFKLSLMEVSS